MEIKFAINKALAFHVSLCSAFKIEYSTYYSEGNMRHSILLIYGTAMVAAILLVKVCNNGRSIEYFMNAIINF